MRKDNRGVGAAQADEVFELVGSVVGKGQRLKIRTGSFSGPSGT
jgi:hypothetical protein